MLWGTCWLHFFSAFSILKPLYVRIQHDAIIELTRKQQILAKCTKDMKLKRKEKEKTKNKGKSCFSTLFSFPFFFVFFFFFIIYTPSSTSIQLTFYIKVSSMIIIQYTAKKINEKQMHRFFYTYTYTHLQFLFWILAICTSATWYIHTWYIT